MRSKALCTVSSRYEKGWKIKTAGSAFVKMLDCTVSKQPVPSWSVFLSCKRNGRTSGIAVSIFVDEVDPKHRPVMASYVRSILK